MSTDMRALFMGMPGPYSDIVLEGLFAAGVTVAAVLLSGQQFRRLRPAIAPSEGIRPREGESLDLPLLNSPVSVAPSAKEKSATGGQSTAAESMGGVDHFPASALNLAFREGIPTYECGDIGQPYAANWLTEMSLDVVCVACWNRIIPSRVLGIPRLGFLNVHPSLLPSYRGPYPLFWQFRAGETSTGVTVHWMDAGLDTGDIGGQRKLHFADGIGGAEAEALCASSGGDLLAELLAKLKRGEATRRPQPAGGSYFPAPSAEDFALDARWHPRQAFNFMRGTAEWGVPFRLETHGSVQWLSDALEWREEAPLERPAKGRVWAHFRGGALLATECTNAVT